MGCRKEPEQEPGERADLSSAPPARNQGTAKGDGRRAPSPPHPCWLCLGLCPLSALAPLALLCWPLLQSSGGAGEHRIPAIPGKPAASLWRENSMEGAARSHPQQQSCFPLQHHFYNQVFSFPLLQLCPSKLFPEGSGKDLSVSELNTQPSGTEGRSFLQ